MPFFAHTFYIPTVSMADLDRNYSLIWGQKLKCAEAGEANSYTCTCIATWVNTHADSEAALRSQVKTLVGDARLFTKEIVG